MSNELSDWMVWEAGVDLVGITEATLKEPNVIVHVARTVHTPVGSAPSGILFWQPDPSAPPLVLGFVSADEKVGAYFGPKIFAGTPFENAPVLKADFEFEIGPNFASAKVSAGGHVFELKLSQLGPLQQISRDPAATSPFYQQGAEAIPGLVELRVDGEIIPVIVPPVGISGGPAAVSSAFGSYAR